MKLLVADSQYSCRSQRDKATAASVKVVIPYPANQMPGHKGLLRVERFFRIHKSAKEKQANRVRSSVERVNSKCKQKLLPKQSQGKKLKTDSHSFAALFDRDASKCGSCSEAENS